MEQVPANRQLFEELRICHLCNIRISIILLITGGIVVHRLLKRRCDSHIIYDEAAFFVAKYTVNSRNGLHQVIALHRLINIHGSKRRNIKARQPHIYNDRDLERTVIILKLFCKFILAMFISDNLIPFFRILIAAGHNNSNLLRPGRSQLKDALIYLHGNRTRIRHDHCLSGQQTGTIIFVVVQDIIYQRINGLLVAKNGLHLSQLSLAFLDDSRIRIIRHDIVFLIDELQCLLIQLQLNNTALVIYRTGGTIFHRLCHIIDVNIITEHLTSVAILHRNRCAGKSDEGRIRQSISDNTCRTDFDFTGLSVDLFL